MIPPCVPSNVKVNGSVTLICVHGSVLIGEQTTGAGFTVNAKTAFAEFVASLAVTFIDKVPAASGIPLKVLVVALNVSQSGSALPFSRVAANVNGSLSASANVA